MLFGQAIRRQRGERSQAEIANLGGPYRQFQARIERGEDIDLSEAVLRKYDNAFGWAVGTAATILQGTVADVVEPVSPGATGGLLGHCAASGRAVALPRYLRTTLAAETLIDVIAAWTGVVVADVQVFDLPDRARAKKARNIPSWMRDGSAGPTIDRLTSRWKAVAPDRAVVSAGVLGADADRVAIDPVPALTHSDQAYRLIDAVNGIHDTIPDKAKYQVAWTLIFLAAQRRPASTGRALLSVEAPLLAQDDPLYRPFEFPWADFLPPDSLSFEPRLSTAANLFAGLSAARDLSMTMELDNSPTPATPIFKGPTVVLPQEFSAGTLVLHNGDISPELPEIVAGTAGEPVLIITRPQGPNFADGLKTNVIEILTPSDNGDVAVPDMAGAALLTRIPDTPHPLLTFAYDGDGRPANVVVLEH